MQDFASTDEKRTHQRTAMFRYVTLLSQSSGSISCTINNQSLNGLGLIASDHDGPRFTGIRKGEIVLVRMTESLSGEARTVRVIGRVVHVANNHMGLSLHA